YLSLGRRAPSPKPAPPLPVVTPQPGEPPLIAQIPIRLPDLTTIESICLLYASHDLIVYDVGTLAPVRAYTGARIFRGVQGRLRTFTSQGTPVADFKASAPQLIVAGKPVGPSEQHLHGYDRVASGVRIRWQARFATATIEVSETLGLVSDNSQRRLR